LALYIFRKESHKEYRRGTGESFRIMPYMPPPDGKVFPIVKGFGTPRENSALS
jgi:hypothetical protein